MSRDQHHSRPNPKSHFQRRPQPGKPGKRRVPKRILPPTPDVPAILAHAADPETDLLAETLAEIGEGPGSGEQGSGVSGIGSSRDKTTSPMDLTDIKVLRAVLRRHGLRPNKILGQHFLIDRSSLVRVVDAAEISAEDHILEVGAGTGVLTVELAKRAQRVVAVELDQAILPLLRESITQWPRVEVLPMNLLQVDPSRVFAGAPYKLVANLPYYITALTLRHFLENPAPPSLLVVMVQKEVAERMVAAPGDLSLLGLSVQFYGMPRIVDWVPARAFFPPPQVDSAIVRVDLRAAPPLDGAARERFFRLAHAGFAEKRKQLHNSLARNLHLPQEAVSRWLAAAEIDPARRAETLRLEDWLLLTGIAEEEHLL